MDVIDKAMMVRAKYRVLTGKECPTPAPTLPDAPRQPQRR